MAASDPWVRQQKYRSKMSELEQKLSSEGLSLKQIRNNSEYRVLYEKFWQARYDKTVMINGFLPSYAPAGTKLIQGIIQC